MRSDELDRRALHHYAGLNYELTKHRQQWQDLTDSVLNALRALGPRGSAVFHMDLAAIDEAVRLVDSSKGDEADALLAGQWEGKGGQLRIRRLIARVGTLFTGDPQLSESDAHRARLLRGAFELHEAGHYAAVILILQQQIEGIVADFSGGRLFFTKNPNRQADLVDPRRLAGIEAALGGLRKATGEDVKQTQARGSMSRHGVMHGREVAYDTRENSAKYWSILDGIVDFGLPIARELAAVRRKERQELNAGTQQVDADGRRVDDREFAETRSVLTLLTTSAMGWWRQQKRFRPDLVGAVYSADDFVKRGLPADHGIETRVSDDGQYVWYWRITPSGWVLGMALSARAGKFSDWRYAGPDEPVAGPNHQHSLWGEAWSTPADWS